MNLGTVKGARVDACDVVRWCELPALRRQTLTIPVRDSALEISVGRTQLGLIITQSGDEIPIRGGRAGRIDARVRVARVVCRVVVGVSVCRSHRDG